MTPEYVVLGLMGFAIVCLAWVLYLEEKYPELVNPKEIIPEPVSTVKATAEILPFPEQDKEAA